MDSKKVSYKLLSIDLDGTLLSPILRRVKSQDCKAVQEYMSLGGIPMINTGRAPWAFRKAMKRVSKFGPNQIKILSCLNGAYIHDFNDNEIIQTTIEDKYVKQILDIVKQNKGAWLWSYITKSLKTHCVYTYPWLKHLQVGYHLSKIRTLNDKWDLTSFKLDIIAINKSVIAKVYEQLLKADLHHVCTVTHSSPRLIEITPLNINKGHSIDYFAKKYKVHADEICSLGDSFNDLSAFKHSALAIGINPKNPNLLEHCTTIIDHKSKGVAEAIRQYLIRDELNNKKYKLLICDLDGTLIDEKTKMYSNATKVALQQVAHRHIPFAICTGRGVYNSLDILKSLQLNPMTNIYVIAHNGAAIFDVTGKKYIYQNPLEPADATKLFDACVKIVEQNKEVSGIAIHQHSEEVLFYNPMFWKPDNFKTTGFEDKYDHWIEQKPIYVTEYPKDVMTYKIVLKISNAKLLEKYLSELKKQFLNLEICASSLHNIEISAKDVNKGNAAKKLSEKIGIPLNNFVALGDGTNDVTMLRMCKNSYAPCYTIPEVLKEAHHVVEDVTINTFASKVINETFLKQKGK